MKSNRAVNLERGERMNQRSRRPFWLPAQNFYALAAVVSLIFFSVIWGVILEADEENAFLIAAAAAILVIFASIFLREVVLSNARKQYLSAQKQLDLNVKRISAARTETTERKITLEQNQRILDRIKKKSDAAKLLRNQPENHREVFEVCDEYLTVSRRQMKNTGAGSPRLAAFRKGREKIKPLHYYHLIEWIQCEVNNLIREAVNRVTIDERLSAAQKVLELIDSGLNFYPNDARLVDSQTVLKELVGTIQVSYWIEQAEKSLLARDVRRAVECLYDARFFLERGNLREVEKQIFSEKIDQELAKIKPEDIKKKEKSFVFIKDLEDHND